MQHGNALGLLWKLQQKKTHSLFNRLFDGIVVVVGAGFFSIGNSVFALDLVDWCSISPKSHVDLAAINA